MAEGEKFSADSILLNHNVDMHAAFAVIIIDIEPLRNRWVSEHL